MNTEQRCLSRTLGLTCALLMLAARTSSLFAQSLPCGGGKIATVTNAGEDFLLVFMANELRDYDQSTTKSDSQIVYIASTGAEADVLIACPVVGFNRTVHLKPYQGATVNLNQAPVGNCFLESNGVVNDTIVHVSATSDIVCYGMNHRTYTSDAFLCLPRQIAGTEYMVMGYTTSGSSGHPSEFAVASFYNANQVTITLPDGTTTTYTLNAGQGVQIQPGKSSGIDDITGSLVHATLPVAVYGGHRRAEIPTDYLPPGNNQVSRDHLAEQIPPLSTWGKSFVFTSFNPDTIGEVVRVLSSADGDTVIINGQVWPTPLAAGQSLEFLLPNDSALYDSIYSITTSQPSLVGEFCHSASSRDEPGDPFFAIIPPLEQTYFDYDYFISGQSQFTGHNYLIVTTEQSGIGSIKIDGAPVAASAFRTLPSPITSRNGRYQYSIATIPAPTPGPHRITSTNSANRGMTILAYGMGKQDSYGYSAGALFRPITGLWRAPDPVGLPYPGAHTRPSFTIRNILGEDPIWLDSIRISYTSNPENIAVEAKNVPMTNFGILDAGADKRIVLSPHSVPTQEITGTARLYYHSGLWFDMDPLLVNFRIEPGTPASVDPSSTDREVVTVRPNPVSSHGSLFVSLESASYVRAILYDELGRIAQSITNGRMNEGVNTVGFNSSDLPNGAYVLEVVADGDRVVSRTRIIIAH